MPTCKTGGVHIRNDVEVWLKDLAARRGVGRAAVALANKTVRTAWAMLRYRTEYEPGHADTLLDQPPAAVAA